MLNVFPTFSKQTQVENITMATLATASGKNDILDPNTECSVGLRDRFNWHCSWLAQWIPFLALYP